MKIEKEVLGLSEVSNVLSISKNAVSNIRRRDPSFPKPFEEVSASPLWKSADIYNYGIKTGRLSEDVILIPAMQGTSKKIAIIGRARTGKSFIVAMFDENPYLFRQVFCANSDDKTACPIHNIFIDIEAGFVEFCSDFHTLYKTDNENCELANILADVELYNKIQIPFNTEDKVRSFMHNIESIIKKIHDIEEQNPDKKKSNTYINVYSRPSEFCKKIMRSAGLKRLEVVDTPGVSGNVEFARISKADLYVFVLKPENSDEAKTLKKCVDEIKPYVATSQVCFLYKMEGLITKKSKYEEKSIKVKENMEPFEEIFSDLRGSIISTGMDLLSPSKSCIMFPTMDEEEIQFPEEMFQLEFEEKILSAFSPKTKENMDKEFSNILQKQGQSAIDFVVKLLNCIPKYELYNANYLPYTTEEFMIEKHDRVKTNDNWRIINDLYHAYRQEKNHLYSYFNRFMPDKYPEEWKQLIIKYLFHTLTEAVNDDDGVGVGTFGREDSPALTMIVEESILAREVYTALTKQTNNSMTQLYRNALKDCGITSKTWEYVHCKNDNFMLKKLEIIDKCLCNIYVASRLNMVLCRYIGGLRKLAEYRILNKFYTLDSECIRKVSNLPF